MEKIETKATQTTSSVELLNSISVEIKGYENSYLEVLGKTIDASVELKIFRIIRNFQEVSGDKKLENDYLKKNFVSLNKRRKKLLASLREYQGQKISEYLRKLNFENTDKSLKDLNNTIIAIGFLEGEFEEILESHVMGDDLKFQAEKGEEIIGLKKKIKKKEELIEEGRAEMYDIQNQMSNPILEEVISFIYEYLLPRGEPKESSYTKLKSGYKEARETIKYAEDDVNYYKKEIEVTYAEKLLRLSEGFAEAAKEYKKYKFKLASLDFIRKTLIREKEVLLKGI